LLCDEEPCRLLDIGCGSGVLSIAARRLGFVDVVSVDHDEAAVRATVANGRRNDMELDARRLDAAVESLPRADLAVANIDIATLQRLLPRLPVGRAIIAGFLVGDALDVAGWEVAARRQSGEWAAEVRVRTLE
jgi:ribosomal protein L11 methyltransferase